MFRLELDLSIHYIPPMLESRRGIILTRSVELPFAPFPNLQIYSREIDDSPGPLGFMLKELTWDIDRQVFLAETGIVNTSIPVAEIPDDLCSWIERGWRFGSFADAYVDPTMSDDEEPTGDSETGSSDEDVLLEELPAKPPRNRPASFNKVLRALVRTMAELDNNAAVAYAIAKTQRFFDNVENIAKENETPAIRKYRVALSEFEEMSFDERYDWRTKIMKTYPRLDRILQST
jgi:hypothetical protein